MKTFLSIAFVVFCSFTFAQKGYLLVKVDADCTVTVDGEESVELAANNTYRFTLIPGTHLIEAEGAAQQKEEIVEINENRQSLLRLTFDRPFTRHTAKQGAVDPQIAAPSTRMYREVPNVKTLDPNGIYAFGTGTNGLQGRGILSLPYPDYTSQEEGILEFTFKIEPDGRVSYARCAPTTKTGIKNAGIVAIKKWRFAPQPAGEAQMVKVKIMFKLK